MTEPLGPLTRRRLLVSGGAVALSAGLTGGFTPGASAAANWLARSTYTGRVGQPFTARPAGGLITWLKLVAVEDLMGTSLTGAPLAGRNDAFLLRFQRTSGPSFAQGPVELRHKQLGRKTLFVVPEGPGTFALVVNRSA